MFKVARDGICDNGLIERAFIKFRQYLHYPAIAGSWAWFSAGIVVNSVRCRSIIAWNIGNRICVRRNWWIVVASIGKVLQCQPDLLEIILASFHPLIFPCSLNR